MKRKRKKTLKKIPKTDVTYSVLDYKIVDDKFYVKVENFASCGYEGNMKELNKALKGYEWIELKLDGGYFDSNFC